MRKAVQTILLAAFALAVVSCDNGTPPMENTSENEAIALRLYELLDAQQWDQLDEVLAPDFRIEMAGSSMNQEELLELAKYFYNSFPDLNHEVVEIFSVGNRVVIRTIDRGTHMREFQGISPTGARIEISQIAILDMRDGKIAEIREVFDLDTMMQQIRDAAVETVVLHERSKAIAAAEAAKEFDKVMTFWAEDAIVQLAGVPQIQGKAAIEKVIREWFAGVKEFEGTATEIKLSPSGDLAYEYGVNRVVLSGQEGDALDMGKYLLIWEKTEGKWLITALSVTSDGPQPVSPDGR